MNRKTALTAFAILLASHTAYAEPGKNYLGANIGLFFAEEDHVNNNMVPDWKLTNLALRLGHNYNRYFAIEGHLSTATDDTNVVGGTSVTLDKKYGLGLYLRGNYWPKNDTTNLYILAGISYTSMDTTLQGSSVKETTNDLSGGLGLDYYFNENTAINVELLQLIHRDNNEAQTLGVGITRTF